MDYREIIALALFLSMILITGLFVRNLRKAGLDLTLRIVAALLILQSMLHFVTYADLLISSLWHIFGSTAFDWDGEILHSVIEDLRQGALTDGIAAFCMLLLWRTGIPVVLGFSSVSGNESNKQYIRIRAWQGAMLFCCLAFFFSCIMCIIIYKVPLL